MWTELKVKDLHYATLKVSFLHHLLISSIWKTATFLSETYVRKDFFNDTFAPYIDF